MGVMNQQAIEQGNARYEDAAERFGMDQERLERLIESFDTHQYRCGHSCDPDVRERARSAAYRIDVTVAQEATTEQWRYFRDATKPLTATPVEDPAIPAATIRPMT